MVVCKYFLQGTCRFGENCKFEHQINDSSQASRSILRQPQTGISYITSTPQNVDLNTLVRSVTNDMLMAEKGGQWLLSCYAPFKDKPCFPGFEDKSFEEIRLGFYEAQRNGTVEQYKQQLQMLLQEAAMRNKALQTPTADIVNMIKTIYNTPVKTDTAFPPTNAANIFGGPPNVFATQQNTPASTFSFAQAGKSVFAPQSQQPPAATSIFARANQSIFGGNAQNASSNVFANAGQNIFARPQQSSGPFGGVTTQNNVAPMFGATAQSNVPFGSAAQSNVPFGSAAQSNVPFGSAAQSNVPFGTAAQSNVSFGNVTQSKVPFGATAPSNVSFGSVAQSNVPFGAAAQNKAPFGTAAQSNVPFASAAQSNTPFGVTTQSNVPFGTPAPQNNVPFGNQMPNQPLFGGQTQPNVFGAQNQQQNSFNTQQQNQMPFATQTPTTSPFNIQQAQPTFGTTQNQQQTPPIFATAAQTSSIFNQQSTNAPASNVFGNSGNVSSATHSSNIFGGAAKAFTQGAQVADESAYSTIEMLSPDDVKAFESEEFEFGKIPELPPTMQMCG